MRTDERPRTLAALKRAIRKGSRIEVVEHWDSRLVGTVRYVDLVQTSGYWFEQGGQRVFAPWPKACDVGFGSDGSFTFPHQTPTGIREGTFRLLEDGPSWGSEESQ